MSVPPVPEDPTPRVASEGTAHTGDTGIHTHFLKNLNVGKVPLWENQLEVGIHLTYPLYLFIAISKGNSLAYLTAGTDCMSHMDATTNILQNSLPLLNSVYISYGY